MKDLLIQSTQEIKEILSRIEEVYKNANEKQSQIDQLINDIEHEIELQNFSAPQMMVKYKELKACFRLRRKYKNDLEYLLAYRPSLNIMLTDKSFKAIYTVKSKMDKKNYCHRIKEELRMEILKEAETI